MAGGTRLVCSRTRGCRGRLRPRLRRRWLVCCPLRVRCLLFVTFHRVVLRVLLLLLLLLLLLALLLVLFGRCLLLA